MSTVDQISKIEKQIAIRAPRSRVWKALTTPSEFSAWFRATISVSQFRPGERADLISTYPGHEGIAFSLEVTEVVPEHRFVWQWNPGAGPASDRDSYTTVIFELQETKDGTLVKVTESGFERVPLSRRAKAFESNTQGWEIQLKNIRDYVEQRR